MIGQHRIESSVIALPQAVGLGARLNLDAPPDVTSTKADTLRFPRSTLPTFPALQNVRHIATLALKVEGVNSMAGHT